jgi:hypothetical protein
MAKGSKPLTFDVRLENVLRSFWRHVEKGEPDECWPWMGPTLRSNRPWQRYGNFNVWRGSSTGGGSKNYRAHRFAWMLMNGPIPDGMNVLHRCDNSNCVNPAHLFTGTQQENVEDQRSKGRLWYGTRNGRSKLTEQDVLDIRASDESDTELGKQYGVYPSTIYMARIGRKWAHLPGARKSWRKREGIREGATTKEP